MSQSDLPLPLYTAQGVRELDRVAIEEFEVPGITLMRRAATACVEYILESWPDARRFEVFCGSGNNAGDGYITAGLLAGKGLDVQACVVGDPAGLGSEASTGYDFCRQAGVQMAVAPAAQKEPAAHTPDVVVDALLGTGLSGDVRPAYLAAIEHINKLGRPVVAVDIPSGLCADTGAILGDAVRATATVTFIGLKRGMFTHDGPDVCGEIRFDDLAVPADVYARVDPALRRLTVDGTLAPLPRRPRNAHKNHFGHVLVVGGDEGMGGAVAMSAEAALRAGAGLVSVATHVGHTGALLARRPELMVRGITEPAAMAPLLARASVIVLGPGLGRSRWSTEVFRYVMAESRDMDLKMVVDADGLNLLALTPQHRDNWMLTPHPGEASNLLQDNRIQADRFLSVSALQRKYGGAVLLKGAGSLVADGESVTMCTAGNPGMSTAGMGDVLSGVIAALAAQGLSPGDAMRLGVMVHATAGDACAASGGERGIVATDLLPDIRRLLNAGS